MYCTNCGAKIDDNAAFCTNCGAKTEAAAESTQVTQVIEQVSAPVMEPVASADLDNRVEAPKEPRKPIDKRVIIGAVVAVVVVAAIAIGMFVVQKASSAQGKWYAYDDYGNEYVLTLSDNGSGYSDDGDSFTWEESKDAVTTDDGDVYEKTDGKLQDIDEEYAYFKSESDAKADYDNRVKEMRDECNQYVDAIKKALVGTWAYKNDENRCTLVVSEDGAWSASSKYRTWGWFSNNTVKTSHNGAWVVSEVEDSELPGFENEIAVNITESTDSDYGDPISGLSASIMTDENGKTAVVLGSGWSKTSDEADASKLKSSEKKEKTGKSASNKGDVYTLSTTSVTGKKLKGKVKTDADGYVIADSDTHEYSKDELKALGLNDAELCIAWNEPFARKGYIFGNSALQEYFTHCSWYTPKSSDVSIHGAAATNGANLKKLLSDTSWKSLSNQRNN